jgi:hypothetical protein
LFPELPKAYIPFQYSTLLWPFVCNSVNIQLISLLLVFNETYVWDGTEATIIKGFLFCDITPCTRQRTTRRYNSEDNIIIASERISHPKPITRFAKPFTIFSVPSFLCKLCITLRGDGISQPVLVLWLRSA